MINTEKEDEENFNPLDPLNLNTTTAPPFMNFYNPYERDNIVDVQRTKDAIEEAKKAEEAERLLQSQQAATIEEIRQQYAAQGRDYGQGGADQATQNSYQGSDGNYAGASTEDYDTPD